MKIDPSIKQELRAFLNKKIAEEENAVTVVSSDTLDETSIKMIEEVVPEMRNAHVRFEVDSSLMAGIIIRRGSRQIDLSLKGTLEQLHKHISV
jgi:F0F1-type ATP synthase delta subunit